MSEQGLSSLPVVSLIPGAQKAETSMKWLINFPNPVNNGNSSQEQFLQSVHGQRGLDTPTGRYIKKVGKFGHGNQNRGCNWPTLTTNCHPLVLCSIGCPITEKHANEGGFESNGGMPPKFQGRGVGGERREGNGQPATCLGITHTSGDSSLHPDDGTFTRLHFILLQ